MKSIFRTLLLITLTSLLTTGCGVLIENPEDRPSEDLEPTQISISKSSAKMNVSQTISLYSTLLNENGHRANVQTISWTISDSSVASLTPSYDGSVVDISSLKLGNATITASYGDLSASCALEVTSSYIPEQKGLDYTYQDYIKNNWYALASSPTLVKNNLLIIPIWFTDSSNYIAVSSREDVRNDIQTAYLGSEGETGWQSVKTFYENESRGKLSFNGVVTDWYECGYSSTSYYSETTGLANTKLLATSAVNWYKSTNNISALTDFDCDHNGYLDGVMLIYAAPDSNSYKKNNDNMWAYCYWLQGDNANVSNPQPNVFFWASYDFMYSSFTAIERTGKTSFGGGDTSNCNVDAHTFIHEMGHVFGLEDYYDYSNQYNPASGFSMQDFNVGAHDPYSRLAYGWDKVYVPTQTSTFHVNPYQESGDLVLLSNHQASVNSPFDEYILLELYSPTGLNEFDCNAAYHGNYPQGPKEYGFRVWHVDARLLYLNDPEHGDVDASKVATEPINGKYYYHMMSNTYYSSSTKDYISPLGSSYANYNILQLIRPSASATYQPTDDFSSKSIFKSGTSLSFSMTTYKNQFYRSGKMNDNTSLGWSVSFNNISSSGADITVTKL